ncbi:MAG: YkgJ family cysteine cluster protein [Kofleriaceae bacterium]
MTAYDTLVAKVDAFVARVEARHPDDLACRPGCASCCHVRLTITTIEAAAVAAWVAAQPAAARAAIVAGVGAAAPGRCAALADDDRCRIYPARPLVCRSHGVPIRLREASLPVVRACALNFTAAGPAAADADCVLDQELVSTTLGLLDRAGGAAPGTRLDLAEVLAGLA